MDEVRRLVPLDFEVLFQRVKTWVESVWPFSNPAYPGRDIPVAAWNALPKEE